MDKFYHARRRRGAAQDDQCRHRHDHPQAVSQDHQAHRSGHGLFSEKRYATTAARTRTSCSTSGLSQAKILVAGDNFGCGSSREHAPWALMDFGIRCVISTSFGDIFYNNCFKNGVLPIKVSPEDLEKLFDDAERGANATLSIDLEKQEIGGRTAASSSSRSMRTASIACSTASTISA
jgi:3-isopropylmalate dehydratase small subunit